jgi:predicted CoA-binding protein
MTTLQDIDDFLGVKRLALVGVSRHERDFTRALFREFAQRGYDVVPVNPNLTEVEGRACFARLQDVAPAVEGALLMTPPKLTDAVVRDCLEAGIQRVWMYRGGGPGAVSREAVQFCETNGIRVIAGHCPLMFWRDSGFFHHLHGWLLKLTGRYPRSA